ncbi:hypothetical protein [Flagellimonas onchidii]|uniref:hypothetical protein n=1 Tax=Flagellimonas onchidii TaxID=2562684 RepID=UPI0010A616E0|nr:hypothetical protein [Allomuricauda onchidii]
MKQFNLLYVFSLAIALALTSCSGKDGINGEIGPQGPTGQRGPQGEQGGQGADGADGTNGVGFDELTKYGHLTMVLEGTRPDGVEFRNSTAFKFTPVEGNELNVSNILKVTENVDITNYEFQIRRFFSSPDDSYQYSRLDFSNFSIDNLGENNEEVVDVQLSIRQYAVIGDDNKYFIMDDTFYTDSEGVSGFEITDITFDAETNHLTFSYSLNVDGNNNDSGNDLSISGTADVYVLEQIEQDLDN